MYVRRKYFRLRPYFSRAKALRKFMETKPNIFNIENKIIAITGGCGLLGKTITNSLIENKAKVVIVDVPEANPEEFAIKYGENALGIPADISNSTEVSKIKEAILKKYGTVDVLINAHQFKPKGFCGEKLMSGLEVEAETFPEELWDSIMEVNLKGAFLMCRELGRIMIGNKSGSIINFASAYGIVSSNPALYENNTMGSPIAYSVSKGGIIMLTKYLAAYWAKDGVRVNSVTPHGVWNNHEKEFEARFKNLSPIKRMMYPDEIVGAILYLSSAASSYATGTNLLIDGGWTAW